MPDKKPVDEQRVRSVAATLLAIIDSHREYVALSPVERTAVDKIIATELDG